MRGEIVTMRLGTRQLDALENLLGQEIALAMEQVQLSRLRTGKAMERRLLELGLVEEHVFICTKGFQRPLSVPGHVLTHAGRLAIG